MLRLTSILCTIGLSVTVFGCALAPGANGDVVFGVTSADGGDTMVTLAECPAAVRDAIERHLDGGSLRSIERTTDHGQVLYEIDVLDGNSIVEFDIAADGTFLGYDADDDEDAYGLDDDDDGDHEDGDDDDDGDHDDGDEIPLSDVPDVVKDAALAAVPGIILEEASVEREDGVLVYELEGESDGQEYEIEVDASGNVLEVEADDDEDDDDDDHDDDD